MMFELANVSVLRAVRIAIDYDNLNADILLLLSEGQRS
jgi:hypothetical protein